MNWSIMKNVKPYINFFLQVFIGVCLWSPTWSWEVDMSRRARESSPEVVNELRWPTSVQPAEELFSGTPIKDIFNSVEPAQSIVILHTEEGFKPDTLRLRKDGNYKIIVANVNEKFKNSSFILDAFGQTLGVYYGKTKTFELLPKVNGIFTFVSPESGLQGKIVVYSDKDAPGPVASTPSEVKK